ncbi:MAG: permease [Gemmatimonadetes bacterium]|nr:permease [Gemmatimonadota bacterium]
MALSFELRRAARSLWRYPTITILAAVALGLGIGLPTAMFSIIDAAVIRGLPIAEPRRLMHLERHRIGTTGEGIGAAARDYTMWTAQQRSFAALGAFRTATATLRVGSNVDRWPVAFVTPNTFGILGARPERGRMLTDDDAHADATPAIVLSFNAWRDRYGSDAGLVGRTISVDGVGRTVVGIMPSGFRFPSNEDAWLPLEIPVTAEESAGTTFEVFGALRPGITRDAAHAELAVIARRVADAFPATNAGLDVAVKPFAERFIGETATTQLFVVLAAVLLVLVVACANVANLLLVRAVHRAREVALSMALGASRRRIVTQLLMESLLLALVGSALGLVVAKLCVTALARTFVSKLPYWVEPRLDARVLLFGMVLTVAAAVLAAVVPALRISADSLSRTVRDNSSGTASASSSGRMMRGLIVVELALSMGLMVNAALLSLGADRARHVEMGVPRTGVFIARVSVPESFSSVQRLDFFRQLEQRIQNDPSVAGAGLMSALPGTHAPFRRVAVEGVSYQDKNDVPSARYAVASPAMLPALHVAPLSGRLIESHDLAGSDLVVLVNERFAKRFLANVEPIGHRIRLGTADSLPWRTIVGVVPNLWMGAFDASPDRNPAGVYVPLAQAVPLSASIAVQVRSGPPLAIASAVRAAAFAINPEVPIYDIRDIPQLVDDGTWFYGMVAGILGVCGAAALLLATVGVYGVIAFSVGRRRREFGVRMALGADSRSIVALVVQQGFVPVAAGLGIGAVLAVVLARGVGSLIFEVSPSNPAVYAGVAAMLAAVALVAMLTPTMSAARISPSEALRSD